MTTRDTYRAECLCGATVESHRREATCPRCGRQHVYEWGRPPLVVSDADWLAHQENLSAAWLAPQERKS